MAKIKICLDAGHYAKYNQSPAVKTYYESDMNWKLHLLLKKYLEQYGFEVVLTRDDKNKDLSVTSRGKKAKGCDLLLSIHSNAVGDNVNEKVDRPVVYVPLNGKGHQIGKMLANCIANTMNTTQAPEVLTRQGNNGDYYGVIRGGVSVGVVSLILEHSFHTNTRSTKWLLDDNNLVKLAKAEAKVIAEYFDQPMTDDQRAEKIVSVDLKQVHKGSYCAEVKTVQRLLKALGYKDQYGNDLSVDGDFGSKTDHAVKTFQRAKKLDDDGYVGEKTWAALLK